MEEAEKSLACNMTGTFLHNMDKKGRINFPVKLREQIGETFWVSRSTSERCLTVYSVAGWNDVMRQVSQLPGASGEKLRRWFCSGAVEVTPDQQGRILIPAALRNYAGLTPDDGVAVIGAGLKAEIWNKTAWEDAENAFDPTAEALLAQLCL